MNGRQARNNVSEILTHLLFHYNWVNHQLVKKVPGIHDDKVLRLQLQLLRNLRALIDDC